MRTFFTIFFGCATSVTRPVDGSMLDDNFRRESPWKVVRRAAPWAARHLENRSPIPRENNAVATFFHSVSLSPLSRHRENAD